MKRNIVPTQARIIIQIIQIELLLYQINPPQTTKKRAVILAHLLNNLSELYALDPGICKRVPLKPFLLSTLDKFVCPKIDQLISS